MPRSKKSSRVDEERTRLLLSLSDAAQREAQLQVLLKKQREENIELHNKLDAERVRLGGFQLELETRNYELPFVAAQLEALLQTNKFSPSVEQTLSTLKVTIDQLLQWSSGHKPTLDPSTWTLLARKLGIFVTPPTRRTPARRPPRQDAQSENRR